MKNTEAFFGSQTVQQFNDLFKQHVPAEGTADSIGGELLRAVSRIVYRYFNDGDMIGYQYGNATCNAAARFVMRYGSKAMAAEVAEMWDCHGNENRYEQYFEPLTEDTLKCLEEKPDLFQQEAVDMFSFKMREDAEYDDDEEEEEY